jgi:hypothetical protein
MILVFKINGDFVMAANATPASHTGDEYISAPIKDDEEFDSRYNYSLVDGFAVKGDLIVSDEAEVTRLQAEYDANQYQRDRKVKYDALNQLELISDDAINGTTTHKDAILAIKAEIPKPI